MATMVLKKKMVQAAETLNPLYAQIDLVGEQAKEAEKIAEQIKKLQDKLKPIKAEQDKLQKMIDALEIGDDEKIIETAAKFSAEIGAKGNKREIKDLDAAKKYLGDELFMKLATITLKNLDDYLTPPQKEEVIKTSRTSRSVKIVPRRA